MSDEIFVINKGVIQQSGTPIDIQDEPINRFVADFIGESNIVKGTMIEDLLVELEGKRFICVDQGINANEPIEIVIRPEESSNLWFDNMVIPKTADNVEGAHAFINLMLDPKIAAQNTEYVSYSTPNKEALKYLSKEMVEDERFYPSPELTDKLEVYENLGKEALAYYNKL